MAVFGITKSRMLQSAVALATVGVAVLGSSGTASAVAEINYWNSACPTDMHPGEGDSCVAFLQDRLNWMSSTSPQLVIDGGFGPKTEAAVIAFQNWVNNGHGSWVPIHTLAVDGIVGPQTKTDLDYIWADFQP